MGCFSTYNFKDCKEILPGTCVYYSKSNITGTGITTGDKYDDVILKLKTYIDNNSGGSPSTIRGYFSGTSPISYKSSTGNFSISQSSTSTNGFLSSTDWNTFNNKVFTGGSLGIGSPIYGGKVGTTLNFKSIAQGSNVTITDNGSTITINAASSTQVNSDWNASSGVQQILNKPTIYQFSGTTSQYTRGDGTYATFPSIPAPQVNSDWNSSTGVSQILNKPIIPAQVNLIAGSNITITGTYPDLTINSTASGSGGSSSFSNLFS